MSQTSRMCDGHTTQHYSANAMQINELTKKIASMPVEQRAALEAEIAKAMRGKVGLPQPGPQLDAYFSKADVLLFGGCVSGETEFLTLRGWKRIDDYRDGDRVAQWDKDTGALTWVRPLGYTATQCKEMEMIEFKSSRMSMVLSDEHRMPLYDWSGKFVVKTARDVARKPSKHKIPVNFESTRQGINLTDTQLRLAVAIHADGNLYVRQDRTARCRMSLRKKRKKERLIGYLRELRIAMHVYKNKRRPTEVRYSFDAPISTKRFSGFWWDASQEQLEIILDEISYWDGDHAGTRGGDISYTSVNKEDADFVQYAAHACGRVANIQTRKSRKDGHKIQYRVSISKPGSVKSCSVIRCDVTRINRVKCNAMYCFSVPTTFWLARHNGKIFITGNSPGGGKSVLCILLALNEHHRSLIVRSAFTDLRVLIDTSKKIVGSDADFVGGSRPEYRKKGGGVIHYMGLPEDGGVGGMQGEDHDAIFIDEAATVTENQAKLIMGWLRTDRPGQRTRVVMASNPPMDSTGDWLITYFAPWLDKNYHNPARPGELRWFLPTNDGPDIEAQEGDFTYIDGIADRDGNPVKIYAKSRTYIPSKFTDNKYYTPEEYARQLAGLPDAARRILATGDFMAERTDDIWQLIPSEWVRAAKRRWRNNRPHGIAMSALGADVAQGGNDRAVITTRYDWWIDKQRVIPGKQVAEGADFAGHIVAARRDECEVTIDMGGGYGGAVKLALENNGIKINEYKGGRESFAVTALDKLPFWDQKAELLWRLREAFDPNQPGGAKIAIPDDDPDLEAEITAVRYLPPPNHRNKIKIEPTEVTRKRFGKSLDKLYSLALCWWKGPRNISPSHPAATAPPRRGMKPKVKVGYANRKRGRR